MFIDSDEYAFCALAASYVKTRVLTILDKGVRLINDAFGLPHSHNHTHIHTFTHVADMDTHTHIACSVSIVSAMVCVYSELRMFVRVCVFSNCV